MKATPLRFIVATTALLVLGANTAQASEDPTTLAGAAHTSGRFFGTSLNSWQLTDAQHVGIVNREFDTITPENELQWDAVEPSRGVFRFESADQILAQYPGHAVRGQTLMTSGRQPAWLSSLVGPALVREVMTNHIGTVLGHYRGRIGSWDVVGEAFDDSASAKRRLNNFQRALGDGYVEEAFRIARAADPDAELCYNDYGIEDWAGPKTQAVHAMVKDLVTRGVPIDCVGFESHFNSVFPVPADFRRTLEEFAALGVRVQLTQLDVAGSGQVQADKYASVVGACLTVPACTGITVFGVRDSDSWRVSQLPLLFDQNGRKKLAYDAVLATLLTP